jgi:hypothetical protein
MAPTEEVPALSGVDVVREETRKWLAWIAMGGYIVLLFTILIIWGVGGGTDDVIKILTATGSLLSGIVGAVVGFYYKSE